MHVGRYILAALVVAVLAVFLVWPIVSAIGQGLYGPEGLTLFWVGKVFLDPAIREWLLNALAVALATTAASLLVGLPLAVLADRVPFRGRSVATALLLVPMILPPFVGALAFQQLFARNSGAVNVLVQHVNAFLAAHGIGLAIPELALFSGGFWAVVLLETLHLYPIMYLNAAAAMANIDPAMGEAARNLGASRWRVFRRITLPLMRPGLFAGATIVFIWSFTELGTPLLLGYTSVLPVKIFDGLTVEAGAGMPAQTFGMVFVMLAASVALYAAGRALFGRPSAAMAGRAAIAATRKRASLRLSVLCWLAFGLVIGLAVLPHVGVVLMAVSTPDAWQHSVLPEAYTLKYLAAVFSERTLNAILNSLEYATLSTLLCAVLGLTISYLVVRLRIRGAGALDALSMLPLAVPGLVMAAGYIAITRPGSFLQELGPMRNPVPLLILAFTVRRIPYMVRSISAGLQQTSETLEEAAQNLGASRLRAVLRVTVPLVAANILAGAILTFSFNMLEVSDSLVLAQIPEYYTITRQIYAMVGVADTRRVAAALGVYGMGLLTSTLLLANLLLGRKMGQLFRV